jgi:hypothetical protein
MSPSIWRSRISGERWAVLNAYIYIAERLDARLASTIAQLEISDPERAKALSQDVLFYVRQKHQDLLTQLAVSIQSYLRDRHHHQEQHRVDQGCRPGLDNDDLSPTYRR